MIKVRSIQEYALCPIKGCNRLTFSFDSEHNPQLCTVCAANAHKVKLGDYISAQQKVKLYAHK